MGEDDMPSRKSQTSFGKALLQNASDEGAAVGLEMGIGEMDVLLCAENPHGMGACGQDDLFRCVGTDITDRSFSAGCLPSALPGVVDRDLYDRIPSKFFEMLHLSMPPCVTMISNRTAVLPLGSQPVDLLLLKGVDRRSSPPGCTGRLSRNSTSRGQDHLNEIFPAIIDEGLLPSPGRCLGPGH